MGLVGLGLGFQAAEDPGPNLGSLPLAWSVQKGVSLVIIWLKYTECRRRIGKQAGLGEGEAQTTLKGNQDHGGTTWQLL